jgi:hypothetical protein
MVLPIYYITDMHPQVASPIFQFWHVFQCFGIGNPYVTANWKMKE